MTDVKETTTRIIIWLIAPPHSNKTIRPELLTHIQASFLWVQTGSISFPMTLAAFHQRSLAARQCLATPLTTVSLPRWCIGGAASPSLCYTPA